MYVMASWSRIIVAAPAIATLFLVMPIANALLVSERQLNRKKTCITTKTFKAAVRAYACTLKHFPSEDAESAGQEEHAGQDHPRVKIARNYACLARSRLARHQSRFFGLEGEGQANEDCSGHVDPEDLDRQNGQRGLQRDGG
jgi:hypothetical protein